MPVSAGCAATHLHFQLLIFFFCFLLSTSKMIDPMGRCTLLFLFFLFFFQLFSHGIGYSLPLYFERTNFYFFLFFPHPV